MKFNRLVDFFLPTHVRNNPSHPKYDELRGVVSTVLVAFPLVCLFPLFLLTIDVAVFGYVVNAVMLCCILLSMKFFGHYRIPMTITAIVTYLIIYEWIRDTGMIYSANLSILHMYLLGAILADKKYGWFAVFGNLFVFIFIYYQTLALGLDRSIGPQVGSAIYTLGMHCLFTLFFGGFLAYLLFDQSRSKVEIQALQERKITLLDQAVKQRTEQLNGMRQTIATDFHDQTGNLLSTISRQASVLQLLLREDEKALSLVESIITNSKELYASSKDFLWNLNHDSDDPEELFGYLTSYGQQFYNQFDVAFSVHSQPRDRIGQLKPDAALSIILIFKEAMTNIIKHSGASEVLLQLTYTSYGANFSLQDNGHWQQPDAAEAHYGLVNISERCKKNNFVLAILKEDTGTTITIEIPLDLSLS